MFNLSRFNRRAEATLLFLDGFLKNPKPIGPVLKKHFQTNPQMGSNDRKEFSSAFFAVLRTLPLLELPLNNQSIKQALFWTMPENQPFPNWWANDANSLSVFDKSQLYKLLPISTQELSAEIDQIAFLESMLLQKPLWIRAQKDCLFKVIKELDANKIEYLQDTQLPQAILLPSKTNITNLVSFKKGFFEVQDWSSQMAANVILPHVNGTLWDCCAASGGKALALADCMPTAPIFASDIRANILHNLNSRVLKAGSKKIEFAQIDALNHASAWPNGWPNTFETILVDAPCSGSGTWARNPEAKLHFDLKKLNQYVVLQQNIVRSVAKRLNKGGVLVYLTCSVFSKENECQLDFFATLGLEKIQTYYFSHTNGLSDYMFCALFQKK